MADPNRVRIDGIGVKTVSVTYERKLNLGDYNSAAIGCTLWADIEDGQDLDAAMRSLWQMAKANVKAQVEPLMAKSGSLRVNEAFLGLPLAAKEE